MFTINCRGRLVDLSRPVVMGILNMTNDSFYQGYLNSEPAVLLDMVDKMISEGAAIIDIGGQSTKPGSVPISAEEEWNRVSPVIGSLMAARPKTIISIDTFHASVAERAIQAGAALVNDVSGGEADEKMITTVGRIRVPYICMHKKGDSATMQANPTYTNVVTEVLDYLIAKKAECHAAGIVDFIADPGFGFGKTIAHNFSLIKHFSVFQMLDCPILMGISRKSTIYKTLGVTVDEALNGSTVLHSIGLMQGANILRVHDVREAVEAVKLVSKVRAAE